MTVSPNGDRTRQGRSASPARAAATLTDENHNLTHEPGGDFDESSDWEPAWSPDGIAIAFVTGRDGDVEMYVFPARPTYGQDGVNLTNALGEDRAPAWRP